jgi:hypothetical protein
MDYTRDFRRTKRGSYFAVLEGRRCTVFRGQSGQWTFYIDGRPAPAWFARAELAMAAVVRRIMPSQTPRGRAERSSPAGRHDVAPNAVQGA